MNPALKINLKALAVAIAIPGLVAFALVEGVEHFARSHPKTYATALAGQLPDQMAGCTRQPDHVWYFCTAPGIGSKETKDYKLTPSADKCWTADESKVDVRDGHDHLRLTGGKPITGCVGKGLAGHESTPPKPLNLPSQLHPKKKSSG